MNMGVGVVKLLRRSFSVPIEIGFQISHLVMKRHELAGMLLDLLDGPQPYEDMLAP